jgi:sugar phosphate isomerase/epimerase
MMDSVARLVEEAERLDVDMALEPVYWHPLEDLETTVEVFEKMNSNRLKMIFDPANVLEFPEIDQNAYWKEWLCVLGDKVEAIHMKDFVVQDGKLVSVAAGTGEMNYEKIIRFIKERKPYIHVTLENTTPENAVQSKEYIQGLYDSCRI